MKIFISGGCKNGKSYYAQRLAKAQKHESLYYIAAMKPVDTEDDERIARHRLEREGWGFTTIERPVDIEKILDVCSHNNSFLLDSLTALLANEMFLPNGKVNKNAVYKIIEGLLQITNKINNIVIVSDYIYNDAVIYDSFTEDYKKSLAEIDHITAEKCDVVLEAVYSNIVIHKGVEIFKELYETVS